MKEKLCAEISGYGGLRFMEEQNEAKLAEVETASEKRAALKCQLQFRQKVISICPRDNKKLFFLSEKGQVKSVKELTENMKALLRQLKNDKTVIRSYAEQNFLIIIHKINCVKKKINLECFAK